jgi:hypothetical protein
MGADGSVGAKAVLNSGSNKCIMTGYKSTMERRLFLPVISLAFEILYVPGQSCFYEMMLIVHL